jgi:alkanesulfonate monooxygenase SsuD/methylene tetrahydromethanopterin reductase-like flavin-dependent oxidoreductase (luciferase family)
MSRSTGIRFGVNLGPTPHWDQILAGARLADERGLSAVSLLDHYHSGRPEWGWLSGWSVWGALAASTSRVRLVPMVIDRLNHLPGVLAKEASVLSNVSGGRFELGIGAGDYFVEQRAWGLPVPDARSRIDALAETVAAVRRVWSGQPVTMTGEHVRLTDAMCLPAPLQPPRIVVGVGASRRLIASAAAYADEINVYADDELVAAARDAIDTSDCAVSLSIYVWDWPENLDTRLATWSRMGVERVFLTVWPPYDSITDVAELQQA